MQQTGRELNALSLIKFLLKGRPALWASTSNLMTLLISFRAKTNILLAIYCHEEFNEKIAIKKVRQLRTKILNELFNAQGNSEPIEDNNSKKH